MSCRKPAFAITLLFVILVYSFWFYYFGGYSSKASGQKYVLELDHSAMSWQNLTDLGSDLYYHHKYFESIEVNKIGLKKALDTFGNQSAEYADSSIILAVLYSKVGDKTNKLLFEPWLSQGTGLGTAHGIRMDYDMEHSGKATAENLFVNIILLLFGILVYFVALLILSLATRSKAKRK